jgi:hypothetical protein
VEIEKILLKIHEILLSLEQTNPDLVSTNSVDQTLIRYIKNLISEIVKLKKESVIQDYMRSVELHDCADKYIKTWIKNILSSISGGSEISSGSAGGSGATTTTTTHQVLLSLNALESK